MYTPRAQIRKGALRHNYYHYHHIIVVVIIIMMVYFYGAYTAPSAIELQSKIK